MYRHPLPAVVLLLFHLSCSAGNCQIHDHQTVISVTEACFSAHLLQDVDRKQHSQRWTDLYLLKLDPHRMHFLKKDVAAWKQVSDSLLEEQNADFPLRVARRFQQRLQESSKQIAQLLDTEHDFAAKESATLKHQEWPATVADKNERWRLRIKHELLIENPQQPLSEQGRAFLRQRYQRIRAHYQGLNETQFRNLFVHAMAQAIDPHSAYMDETFLTMFRTSFMPNFTLGLPLEFRDGDLWIQPCRRDPQARFTSDRRWRILAVREKGQQPIHLSGLTQGTALRTIISPTERLKTSKHVLLDLDDPYTGQRKLVPCQRYRRRR